MLYLKSKQYTTQLNKKDLCEAEIYERFITPAIVDVGWDRDTQVRREVTLTPGPIIVGGLLSARNKKKWKRADYVLYHELGVPIALVEAKDNKHKVSSGLQQGIGYARILDVPSAFSSNGDAFAYSNFEAIEGEDMEGELGMDAFPGPEEPRTLCKALKACLDRAQEEARQMANQVIT